MELGRQIHGRVLRLGFQKDSHAGLLEEGCKYFRLRLMKEVYGIKPGVENFTCMVDLYGRAGHLDKAKEFIHENDAGPYAGPFVILSNMCATSDSWEEAAKVRSRTHKTEIYSYLDELIGRSKEIGYSSDVKLVMQDVEEEQREVLLGYHSEKLAIVYGIISTTSEMPIRIMMNLRRLLVSKGQVSPAFNPAKS
uniref:DYW domain-containing protein n=1 Tax=Fagus sylvatica TaxID=28930 RepID=A0A2N9GH81_FAGSY